MKRRDLLGLTGWWPLVARAATDAVNPDDLRFAALAPRKPDELAVGLLVDFPPYGLLDDRNKPDGFDADVARLLGADWHQPIQFVPVSGAARIPFLLSGKVDLLIASLAITPERAKLVAFSRPYSAATIVVYGAASVPIKGPADLRGLRVAVAQGSTQDVALTAVAPEGTRVQRVYDDASASQALVANLVEAIGCSTTVAADIARRTGNRFEKKFVLRQQLMGMAVRPDRTELLAKVNAFIGKRLADGTLNGLYRKWLKTDLPDMPKQP